MTFRNNNISTNSEYGKGNFMNELTIEKFDFKLHQQNAIEEFTAIKPLHEAFGVAIQTILIKCLHDKNIKYHSIETRTKSIKSFAEKAIKPLENDISKPKYYNPIKEITDLTAARIITFFPITINEVNEVLYKEFIIIEKSDKSDILDQQEKLGYKSVHYLIKLKPSRCDLSEYKAYSDLIAEIQVRTILQHAWAEIEHDIEYKSEIIIPKVIKRRFMALAGLLEIADREFESIQNDNEILKKQSRVSVNSGKLQNVEITKDSIKAYLMKKIIDCDIAEDSSYEYTASVLKKMGFKDLQQVDDCIKNYNTKNIHDLISSKGRSQLVIFENLLILGMGQTYIDRHPYNKPEHSDIFIVTVNIWNRVLSRFIELGITIGNYIPGTNTDENN